LQVVDRRFFQLEWRNVETTAVAAARNQSGLFGEKRLTVGSQCSADRAQTQEVPTIHFVHSTGAWGDSSLFRQR
jgi:hypothetical protein